QSFLAEIEFSGVAQAEHSPARTCLLPRIRSLAVSVVGSNAQRTAVFSCGAPWDGRVGVVAVAASPALRPPASAPAAPPLHGPPLRSASPRAFFTKDSVECEPAHFQRRPESNVARTAGLVTSLDDERGRARLAPVRRPSVPLPCAAALKHCGGGGGGGDMKQWKRLTGLATKGRAGDARAAERASGTPPGAQQAGGTGRARSSSAGEGMRGMAVTQTDSMEDEFQQGLQEVGEMRDKYERLLAAVADAQERAAAPLHAHTPRCTAPSPPTPHACCHWHSSLRHPSTSHATRLSLPPYLSSHPPLPAPPPPPVRASECAEALHQLAAVVADAFGGVEEGGAGDTLLAAAAVDGRLAELLYFYQTLAEPAEALLGEMQHVVVRCSTWW
ncbi:unnamed protein product, partial [Closterium sp. NIES-54]